MYILKLHHSDWGEADWDFDIGIAMHPNKAVVAEFNDCAERGKSFQCAEILKRYILYMKGGRKQRFERIIEEIEEKSAEEVSDYTLYSLEVEELNY
jgi:hypothetical protein